MQQGFHGGNDGRRARLALVVREGLRGNHLLFDTAELAASARTPEVKSQEVARELARTGLRLMQCASLDEARAIIAGSTPACRAEFARMYLAFLGRCASAQGPAS